MRYPPLDALLQDTAAGLSQVTTDLSIADVRLLKSKDHIYMSARSLAYVRISALLEKHVKSTLRFTLVEISNASAPGNALRRHLLAVALHGKFESLRDVGGIKKWTARNAILLSVDDVAATRLDGSVLPLDNRTLRFDHFSLVWETFGFPGNPVPGPLHKLALTELADLRNDIAHGALTPLELARLKTTADVHKLVRRVEEIVLHLHSTVETYLSNQMFLK